MPLAINENQFGANIAEDARQFDAGLEFDQRARQQATQQEFFNALAAADPGLAGLFNLQSLGQQQDAGLLAGISQIPVANSLQGAGQGISQAAQIYGQLYANQARNSNSGNSTP